MRWWLVPVAVCVLSAPVHAQGWIDPVRPVRDFGVHKLRTAVTVRVQGRVAHVEVEEWFRNDGGALGEGDYLYPLPGEAVFSNFSLFQGDRELRGETMDAGRARSIYEEIVRAKRDPALIERAAHRLLRARVFPIAAGETRKITLRYTQLLPRTGDALQFKYAAGARNSDVTRVVRNDVARERRPDRAPLSFTLVIEDATGFGNPFSPTHQVSVQRTARRLTVRPQSELSGDFDVFLPLRGAAVGLTMITHRPSSEPGFFMLTLSPAATAERAVPRDVTAVLDVSGSMSGEKLEQARSALHALLRSLSGADRFRLIAFSDQVRLYRREWIPATNAAVEQAAKWVDGLRAEGGTNIAGALEEAFEATTPEARLSFVIFITDGLPSVGEQNAERIAERVEHLRARARIFAFGVGYDVNTYLLDRLSAAARGSTQYVRPGESVERPIAALATKIRFPVLADLRIGNTPVRIDEIYPAELPDLFAGEELVIVGRYRGAGRGNVTITGARAGRRESFSTVARFEDHELANDYIPKIWASRKVGFLSQKIRLHGQDRETLEQLRETALRYGVLSEYTSYLVQEPMDLAATGNVPPATVRPRNTEADVSLQQQRAAAGQASGRAAVTSAETARMRRESRTLAETEQAAAKLADARDERRADTRTVAGRVFRNVNGTWIDTRHQARGDVVSIEPFSPAYFALLRALPELEPYWKAYTNVIVAGMRTSIKLGAGGVQQLGATSIAETVKRFRN
jgi:Ca-activated chloride channel family protein